MYECRSQQNASAFFSCGRLPHGVRQILRPFVVGRRNWLFADTVAGARASANLYSLVETCKANGVDPYTYLVSLFSKLPTAQTAYDFEALTFPRNS